MCSDSTGKSEEMPAEVAGTFCGPPAVCSLTPPIGLLVSFDCHGAFQMARSCGYSPASTEIIDSEDLRSR